MRLPVIRTDRYLQDLLAAWDYSLRQSLAFADRTVGEIEGVVDQLAEFPDLGEQQPQHGLSCRRAIAGRYLIYYERRDDCVRVLRAIHSARRAEPLDGE